MSKRELVLLQLLAAIALVGLSFIYLYMPAVRRKASLEKEQESLETQEIQVRSIVNLTGLEEALEEEKAKAGENYDYFYSRLNSYTIDGILNELVTESGLEVQTLSIGQYNPIEIDVLQRGQEAAGEEEDVQTEDFLLGSYINLSVDGSYSQVLGLVDKLKKESTCIEVTSLTITRDRRNVVDEESTRATMTLLIYGIEEAVEEDA